MRLGPALAAIHTTELAAVHDSLPQLIQASKRLGRPTCYARRYVPSLGHRLRQPASLVKVLSILTSRPALWLRHALTRPPLSPPFPPATDHTTHTRPLKWRPPHHPPYPGSCCPSPGASGGGQTSASKTTANFQTLSCALCDMHPHPAKTQRHTSPSSWNSQRDSTRPRTALVYPGRIAPGNNIMVDLCPARRYPRRGGENTPA